MATHRVREEAIGDLAERRAVVDGKYSKDLEAGLKTWIESSTGQSIGGDFQLGLKSGVILCNLINALQPGSVAKVNPANGMKFKEMENIGSFLKAAALYGVKQSDLFQSPDLYEGGNMTQVQLTLNSLRNVQKIKGGGGTVAVEAPKDSILMPTKTTPVVTKPKVEIGKRDIDRHYDPVGKDVAGSLSKPAGSGRAGENTFGDLSERVARMEAKYDKSQEDVIRAWIEKLTGDKIGPDFQEGLKSGAVLCNLINKLKPGSVKSINSSTMPFKQMENISNFIAGAAAYGLQNFSLFRPADLYENTNMTQVLLCLQELHRRAEK